MISKQTRACPKTLCSHTRQADHYEGLFREACRTIDTLQHTPAYWRACNRRFIRARLSEIGTNLKGIARDVGHSAGVQ
jgi:hypothetical protein